jgi:hypothetical protein
MTDTHERCFLCSYMEDHSNCLFVVVELEEEE